MGGYDMTVAGLSGESICVGVLGLWGSDTLSSTAPDGTMVLSMPFRMVTGDAIEIALWEEDGQVCVSDRGRLAQALLLYGRDGLACERVGDGTAERLKRNGVSVEGGSLVMRVAPERLHVINAIHALVQVVLDVQVLEFMGPAETWPQPAPRDDGLPVCDIGCYGDTTGVYFHHGEWHIYAIPHEIHWSEGYCPDCGRWLGVDADGNPVVGPPGWTPEEGDDHE